MADSPARRCGRCDAPAVSGNARFCVICGGPFAEPLAEPAAPPAQPPEPLAQPPAPLAQPAAPRAQPLAPIPAPAPPLAQPPGPLVPATLPPTTFVRPTVERPAPRPRRVARWPFVGGAIALVAVVTFSGALLALRSGEAAAQPGTTPAQPGPAATGLPAAAAALTGTISLGPEQPVVSQTAEPGSDSSLAAPAGGPVAGLEIAIPGDAYPQATEFAVSARPISVAGYGGAISPISDLVTVENGGAYAAVPMTVTVPVRVPAGLFAMGFFLKPDGSLEPMPLLDESPTSVTVATRHFSSFFIAAIAEAALPANIGTGYRVREDDFQTPNYGSFVSDGGHCAGQSLASMWYFEERRAGGAPALWGLTDNNGQGATPTFWRDDSNAYRLASSVQEDLDWGTLTAWIEKRLVRAGLDRLEWDAFRYAVLVTGQPQYVALADSTKKGGHAVVAYAATPSGLWIADPNYPGELRDIAWDAKAGAFAPYPSGETAESSDHNFDRVGFIGKAAYIDWAGIGARWAELDAGKIGSDRFPDFTPLIRVQASDGTTTDEPLTNRSVDSTTQWLGLDGGASGPPLRAMLYLGTKPIAAVDGGYLSKVTLGYGINDLGIFVEGQNAGGEWNAVGFVRYELVAPPPDMSPAPSAPPSPTPTPAPRASPTDSGYDCSNPPAGSKTSIAYVKWSLHCQAIGP